MMAALKLYLRQVISIESGVIHTYIHKYTHIHTYIHTHIQTCIHSITAKADDISKDSRADHTRFCPVNLGNMCGQKLV